MHRKLLERGNTHQASKKHMRILHNLIHIQLKKYIQLKYNCLKIILS